MGSSDLDDFDAFYRRTYASAYRTALGVTASPELAEEVVQEAYCAAYRGRGGFRGDAPAENWLQRIVVREAIDQCRRRRSRPTLVLDAEPEIEDREPAMAVSIDRLALLAALSRLQARQRAAIVLRYFHDYPLRTVGEILGTSEGGATMLVQRALAHLRLEIAGETVGQTTSRRTEEAHE